MDAISICLDLTPIPFLKTAWSLFSTIWGVIQTYKESKVRLETLSYCIAQLICAIDGHARSHKLVHSRVQIRRIHD